MATRLAPYSLALLRLAAEVPGRVGFDELAGATIHRSPICGSRLAARVTVEDGRGLIRMRVPRSLLKTYGPPDANGRPKEVPAVKDSLLTSGVGYALVNIAPDARVHRRMRCGSLEPPASGSPYVYGSSGVPVP